MGTYFCVSILNSNSVLKFGDLKLNYNSKYQMIGNVGNQKSLHSILDQKYIF